MVIRSSVRGITELRNELTEFIFLIRTITHPYAPLRDTYMITEVRNIITELGNIITELHYIITELVTMKDYYNLVISLHLELYAQRKFI